MLFKRGLAVLGLTSLMAFGLVPGSSTTAHADAKVVAKYVTQRMSDANLTSTQVGTYQKGAAVNARCWVAGQNVRNEAYKWSTRWYRDTSGWYTAAVDLNYDPAKVIPGTSACGATAPGLKTDTWYTITNSGSGKRVDVRGGSNKNGTAIQQYAANTTAAQQFRFASVGGRFYAVESKLAGSNVWDVSKSNGTKVQIWGWGGQKGSTSNQQWLVYSPSGKLTDVEFRVRANTNKCLDVPGGSKNNSVQLQVYACNSTKAQRYSLKAVSTVTSSMAQFVSKYNGKVNVTSVIPSAPLAGECTSFATRYLREVLGVTVAHFGHAYTWAGPTDSAGLAAKGLKWHAGATDFRDGDILVWKEYRSAEWQVGSTGHVGIGYGGRVFDQNTQVAGRPKSSNGTYGVGFVNFHKGGYLGYWRRG